MVPGRRPTPSFDNGPEAHPPLRRELLLAFAVLLAAAVIVAAVALVLALPGISSPLQGTFFIAAILLGDLLTAFFFGRQFLRRILLEPIERLVEDARRIATGDYRHRMTLRGPRELDLLAESLNAMAERMIADQELLSENIASLEATNRALVEARDRVIQAARLASVGSLAAGIAHEVGNPLGAIMAFADVAASRAREQGASTDVIEAIRTEAGRIDRIVRGLLDYARPRSEEIRSIDPGEVVHSARRILEDQGQLADVETEWPDPQPLPRVRMNPHRLEQVLVNLLLNAVHATQDAEGRWIRVQARLVDNAGMALRPRRIDDPPGINYAHRRRWRLDLEGRPADVFATVRRAIAITVEDNGTGLPEEDVERVFDPFFTTKAPGEGTGLGLAICAQLIEDIGGRIRAANRPDGGAVFTILLPVGEPRPDGADDAGKAEGSGGQENTSMVTRNAYREAVE